MKDKIEQLAKGKFEYRQPELLLSVEKILIRAEAGKSFRGSFRVSNSKKRKMKGVLYSDSRMFRVEKEQFIGEENEIFYVFHGENAKAGETYEGNLQIITDAGETKLPYGIQVVFPCFQTSIGEVRDLFQFTSLAKADWEEAERLFFDCDFSDTMFYHDSKYRLLYQVLSSYGKLGRDGGGMLVGIDTPVGMDTLGSMSAGMDKPVGMDTLGGMPVGMGMLVGRDVPAGMPGLAGSPMSIAMEEFLVAADKKMPVDIVLETTEFSYKAGAYSFMDKLVLRKTGWGYAAFRVEYDAAFIRPERDSFTAGDFVDGRLEIGFVIRTADMKNGIHSGKIRIFSAKKQMEASIICHMESRRRDWQQLRIRKKYAAVGLTKNYLLFRSGKRDAKQYVGEAEKLLAVFRQEEIGKGHQDLMARFYQIHIWQASGKEAAAKNALAVLAEKEGGGGISGFPEEKAALYYLLAMQKKPTLSAEEAAGRIRLLYRQNPERWLLLWFLLYLDKAYQNPKDRYEAIRQHADSRSNSPVLFFEALAVLRENPSLLCRLDGFELRLMQFAVNYSYFTDELVGQLAYLAAREKSMPPALYRVLAGCYAQRPGKELLHVICTLVVRNGEKSPRYFQWLSRGVEEQLRITQLMEYYIACMPEDSEEAIHPNACLYFTYQNQMSSRRKALLYANLIRHKQEQPDIYRNYRKQLEEFALDQVRIGAISRNLAVIYDEVFSDGFPREEDYQYLPDIAFSYELSCPLESIESVCVAYPGEIGECVLPIIRQSAVLPLYTKEAELFLVDKAGMYYPIRNFWKELRGDSGKTAVRLEKLLHLEKHLWKAYDNGCEKLPLLVHLKEEAEAGGQEVGQDERLLGLYQKLIELPSAPMEAKEACIRLLLDGCNHLERGAFAYYFKMLPPKGLEEKARTKLINLLLEQGFDEEAYGVLWDYGAMGADPAAISGFVARQRGERPEEFLLELAEYAFEGGSDKEEVLSYLCKYYHGSTRQMFDIWNAARNAEMDTESLEESLLGQMLFTENFVGNAQAVFMNYYRHGTNHKLIRAYLSYFAHKYLTKDWIVSPEMLDVMEREAAKEENKVYSLALLKAYSKEEQLTERQMVFVDYNLQQLLQDGILLPFYRSFGSFIKLPEGMHDKYYIEHHADPENKVKIYYRFEGEEQYQEAEMEDAGYGIFISGFVLFEAEGMQYYITEQQDGQEAIVESATVTMDTGVPEGQDSRYNTLNMIISAYRKQDDAARVMDLLEHYIKTAYQAEHIFKPIW